MPCACTASLKYSTAPRAHSSPARASAACSSRRASPSAKAARGRAFDNIFVERLWRSVKHGDIKHEDIYLKGYSAMGELLTGLTQYFAFYNGQRMHRSLGNKTPDAVYAGASGGGALIVDKYPHEPGTLHREFPLLRNRVRSKVKTGAAPSSCEKSSTT